MKKLYRKGTVHPSPHIKSDDNLLPFLPVAIFYLTTFLSPEDRELLAYLFSTAYYSGDRIPTSRLNKPKAQKKSHFDNHSPLFHCDCFSCYTSYWVRWDASLNRQLIHEIIDAFEDSLEKEKKKRTTGKKDRRKRSAKSSLLASSSFDTGNSEIPRQLAESIVTSCPCSSSSELADDDGGCNDGSGLEPKEESPTSDDAEEAEEDEEEEMGTVGRIVSFIGEKVFGMGIRKLC